MKPQLAGTIVRYSKWTCQLEVNRYAANPEIIRLDLKEVGSGEPIAVATVYHKDLKIGEVGIKDWGGQEEMYGALLRERIIHPFHRLIESGYVKIKVCKLEE